MLEEAIASARALGLRPTEAWAHLNLGLVHAWRGETAAGRDALERARALAAELDAPRLAAVGLTYRAFLRRASGDAAGALADADAAIATLSAREDSFRPLCRTARAAALLDAGRAAEALEEADLALAARDAQGGMEEMEVDLLLARHDALAALGQPALADGALAAARTVLDRLVAAADDPHFRRTLCENVPAHARLLRLAAARGG